MDNSLEDLRRSLEQATQLLDDPHKRAVHICITTAALAEMKRKDQRHFDKVLLALHSAGRFSVFEATENETIAKVMDELQERGFIEVDPSPGFPWSNVKLTPAGLKLAGIQEEKGKVKKPMGCVLQPWVCALTFMMQSVLIECVRGPDNIEKYRHIKYLLRWFRRCILHGAFESTEHGRPYVFATPAERGGGSFTGPSFAVGGGDYEAMNQPGGWEGRMDSLLTLYLQDVDGMPHHFHLHFMHAVEILGYKHPEPHIRKWWCGVYHRLVSDMHLMPESEAELDQRLGDTKEGWLARADEATQA